MVVYSRRAAVSALVVSLTASLLALAPASVTSSLQPAVAQAAKPKKISLSASQTVVAIGQSVTVKVKATPSKASRSVKWSSSDKKIATVSSKGKVTGKKAGTVTIKAISGSSSSAYALIGG
jgi:uncharacterized protein YjdB